MSNNFSIFYVYSKIYGNNNLIYEFRTFQLDFLPFPLFLSYLSSQCSFPLLFYFGNMLIINVLCVWQSFSTLHLPQLRYVKHFTKVSQLAKKNKKNFSFFFIFILSLASCSPFFCCCRCLTRFVYFYCVCGYAVDLLNKLEDRHGHAQFAS